MDEENRSQKESSNIDRLTHYVLKRLDGKDKDLWGALNFFEVFVLLTAATLWLAGASSKACAAIRFECLMANNLRIEDPEGSHAQNLHWLKASEFLLKRVIHKSPSNPYSF